MSLSVRVRLLPMLVGAMGVVAMVFVRHGGRWRLVSHQFAHKVAAKSTHNEDSRKNKHLFHRIYIHLD